MPTAEEILQREVAGINLHLPKRRISLADLLNMEDPHVVLRDGSHHHFRKSVLKYILSILDETEAKSLRLPIILEISTVNRGHFRVRGWIEVKVIDKILGKFDPLNERFEALYPRYLLPRVRRALPTATTYAFISE